MAAEYLTGLYAIRMALTFVGAIFEILRLPALIATLFIPVTSMVFLVKEKFRFRPMYLHSVLIVVTAVVYVQHFR
jgi:hypothetical protein